MVKRAVGMTEVSRRSLLAVLAHPDDESFGCGGVLAKYAAEGVRVGLICATRGEAGEISDPSLATREDLGCVREQELRGACAALGVEELFILGYRDSGMAGTPENQHPQALCQISLDEVVGRIVEIIRRLKPHVMVTFDENGGYGHPDHIFIHRAARAAFAAAGEADRYVEQLKNGLEPHRPARLYYFGFPRSMVRAFREALIAAGIQSDFSELDPETLGVSDEEITTVVDVSAFATQKERAAQCHRTQIQGDQAFGWIPEGLKTGFLSAEHLIRAEPPFAPGHDSRETDLFGDIES